MTLPLPTRGALLSPSTPRAVAVVFSNAAGVWRYTNWTSTLTIGRDVFESVPLLTARQKSPNGGGLEDPSVEVEIDKTKAPLPSLVLPFKYQRTLCEVYEVYPDLNTCEKRILFSGIVGSVKSKPHANSFLSATITLRGPKALLQVPMGISCTSTCAWVFGDKNCGKCPGSVSVSDIQTRVDGVLNRVSFFAPLSEDAASGKYVGGTLSSQGIKLGASEVVEKDGNVVTLDFMEIPPPSLNGTTGSFSYGCNKTLHTCRNVWDNELRFCGLGIAMPLTNPTQVDQT